MALHYTLIALASLASAQASTSRCMPYCQASAINACNATWQVRNAVPHQSLLDLQFRVISGIGSRQIVQLHSSYLHLCCTIIFQDSLPYAASSRSAVGCVWICMTAGNRPRIDQVIIMMAPTDMLTPVHVPPPNNSWPVGLTSCSLAG